MVKEEHHEQIQEDYVTLKMLEDAHVEKLELEGNVYLIEKKEKILIVKRTGKCDYKKCKNACCKFCSVQYPHEYFEGFGEYCEKSKLIIIDKTCKFLDKNGTCKKWEEKQSEVDYSIGYRGRRAGFPRACEQFPLLSDGVYHKVMDVCTFKYKVIKTILTLREKTTKEMLLSFKQQW